jgi:hypothetical protein
MFLYLGKIVHLWVNFKFVGNISIKGINMSVVEIDERGRMTIPSKVGVKKSRAIVIPAGAFFITIPLPTKPQETAQNWLPTDETRDQLKAKAEDLARQDAAKRAKRRNQL